MSGQCDPNSFPNAPTPPPSGQVYCANLFGNVGRNQIVGPRLFDLDFSVFKNLRITERISTQFRVEFFNILNHPSFLAPINNEPLFSGTTTDPVTKKTVSDGKLMSNAGIIDTTSTDSRQIQFGLKINW